MLNIPEPSSYPLMPNMEDCLIVSLDKQKMTKTWLTIGRKDGDKINIINMFKDKEAEELYKKLVDWGK